ncbi:hypothetical protein [Ruegeria arenilitoris]|uniref:hypothetical protein n=1 Tax=Ruegeria arenilitoris TaxID=1173585 RepID=UPI0014801F68|nr:hypothetical protein [Ruegeria arenilitoris]
MTDLPNRPDGPLAEAAGDCEVFGLGIATILTLFVTPSFLAMRVRVTTYAVCLGRALARPATDRSGPIAQDMAVDRAALNAQAKEVVWQG